jgi:hypothetical protein
VKQSNLQNDLNLDELAQQREMLSFDTSNAPEFTHMPNNRDRKSFKYNSVPIDSIKEKGDKDAIAKMSASSIAEIQMDFRYWSRRPATIQTKKERFQ